MLLVYAVAIGMLIGLATRGHMNGLASVRIRFWPIALAGLFFQAILFSSPLAATVGSLGPALYVTSTALVMLSLIANYRQPGFWLIIAGAFLNFAAIVANGGYMPASPAAVTALSGAAVLPTSEYTNSVIASGSTTLSFLGDIFVLPRPLPLANVFSIGDVLIGVGGAWFVIATMHAKVAPLTRAVGKQASRTPATRVKHA